MNLRLARTTRALSLLGFLVPCAAYAQARGEPIAPQAGTVTPAPALVVPPVPKPSAAALGVLSAGTVVAPPAATPNAAAPANSSPVEAVPDIGATNVRPTNLGATSPGATNVAAMNLGAASGSERALGASGPASGSGAYAPTPFPVVPPSRGGAAARPSVQATAPAAPVEAGLLARLRVAGADAIAASDAINVAGLALLVVSLAFLAFVLLDRGSGARSSSPAAGRVGRRGRTGGFVSHDAARLEATLRSRGSA